MTEGGDRRGQRTGDEGGGTDREAADGSVSQGGAAEQGQAPRVPFFGHDPLDLGPAGRSRDQPRPFAGAREPDLAADDADALSVDYPGSVVFSLRGASDAAALPPICRQLRERMRHDHPGVIVNLTAVTFLDSAGIGALVSLANELRRSRKHYRVVARSDQPLRSVLDLAGVSELIELDETVADALASLE
jgi:anti-sigma B factor antagonist